MTSINEWIEVFRIIAKHNKDGIDARYVMEAVDDAIYINLNEKQVPLDSSDGKFLYGLGFFISGADVWATYT